MAPHGPQNICFFLMCPFMRNVDGYVCNSSVMHLTIQLPEYVKLYFKKTNKKSFKNFSRDFT